MAALLDQFDDICFAGYVCFSHVLNVYSPSFIFPDLQVSFVRVEQISNTLLINFHKRDFELILDIAAALRDSLEHLFNESWNKAPMFWTFDVWPHACICFSTGGLAVSEGCAIDPFENAELDSREYLSTSMLPTL